MEARIAAELSARAAAITDTICITVPEAGRCNTLLDGTQQFQFVCMDNMKSEANFRAAIEYYSSPLLDTEECRANIESSFEVDDIQVVAGHWVTRRWKNGDTWMSAKTFMIDNMNASLAKAPSLPEAAGF